MSSSAARQPDNAQDLLDIMARKFKDVDNQVVKFRNDGFDQPDYFNPTEKTQNMLFFLFDQLREEVEKLCRTIIKKTDLSTDEKAQKINDCIDSIYIGLKNAIQKNIIHQGKELLDQLMKNSDSKKENADQLEKILVKAARIAEAALTECLSSREEKNAISSTTLSLENLVSRFNTLYQNELAYKPKMQEIPSSAEAWEEDVNERLLMLQSIENRTNHELKEQKADNLLKTTQRKKTENEVIEFTTDLLSALRMQATRDVIEIINDHEDSEPIKTARVISTRNSYVKLCNALLHIIQHRTDKNALAMDDKLDKFKALYFAQQCDKTTGHYVDASTTIKNPNGLYVVLKKYFPNECDTIKAKVPTARPRSHRSWDSFLNLIKSARLHQPHKNTSANPALPPRHPHPPTSQQAHGDSSPKMKKT